jgi:predicted ribosome quality control (RQC) complex YloA/Tae2 family protein
VSNAIRYDSLLVRDLAVELHGLLAGCRLDELCLDRDALRVLLRCRAARRAAAPAPVLLWQLHPDDGSLAAVDPGAQAGGRVQLAAPTLIRSVSAPPDERILHIELDGPDAAGSARTLIIELVINQWNAIAVGADGRITAVLRERRTGRRELRAGVPYAPPARSARLGRDGPLSPQEWSDTVGAAAPGERMNALVRSVAYTSPLNAAAILGDADVSSDAAALDRARERCNAFVWSEPVRPVLMELDGRAQPYSRAVGDGTSMPDLLAAFAAAVARQPDAAAGRATERALDVVAQRIEAARRRIGRLDTQQEGAASEAAQLRAHADLLLAQLHRVARGATEVMLDDFNGGTVRVELDPTQSAADNAARLYERARRRDRAAARIPALLATAHAEIAKLDTLAQRIRSGELDTAALEALRPPARAPTANTGPGLPYREYRTSRGLEVRVGRGSRANDELTFRHAGPNDVWLHARDAAGAHVVLRWGRADENPAASDIAEAAMLAALFSRARTSGVVAVDWTRRKHVRKPRKSPPGRVLPERVKTVFVTPDAAAEERMRHDSALDESG